MPLCHHLSPYKDIDIACFISDRVPRHARGDCKLIKQVLINLAKPYIDRLIYRQDQEQVSWIEQLDSRLLEDIGLTRAEADAEGRKPFWMR